MANEKQFTSSIPYILIMLGIFLGFMMINISFLAFFQPIFSVLFLFLGFYKIRQNHVHFSICWVISIVMLCYQLLYLVIQSVPSWMGTQIYDWKDLIYTALYILLLLFFRSGVFAVGTYEGGKPKDFLLWLIFVFILKFVVTFSTVYYYDMGIMVVVGLYILFITTFYFSIEYIRSMNVHWQMSKPYVGYKVLAFIIGYSLLCIALFITITISTSFSKGASVFEQGNGVQNERISLIEKGFPKDLLADLDAKAIINIQDAKSINILDGRQAVF